MKSRRNPRNKLEVRRKTFKDILLAEGGREWSQLCRKKNIFLHTLELTFKTVQQNFQQ